eukprot:GEMP01003946.1.p1 GENE.GEMP01003946.1~~GEMP01003946.1.p1  ORF type:complete len:1036 (+),score=169.76 GEMP01003946.1:32-3139(+)
MLTLFVWNVATGALLFLLQVNAFPDDVPPYPSNAALTSLPRIDYLPGGFWSAGGTRRRMKEVSSSIPVWLFAIIVVGSVIVLFAMIVAVVWMIKKKKWKYRTQEILTLRDNSLKYHQIFVRQTEIHDQFLSYKEEHYQQLQRAHLVPTNEFRQNFQQYDDDWRIFNDETKFHYDQMKELHLMLPKNKFKAWHMFPPFFRIKYEDILILNTSRQLMYKMIGKLASERNKLFSKIAPEDVPPIPELPFTLDDADADIRFVRQLESMTHPKLTSIKIREHGVFGELSRETDKIQDPEAVVVDALDYEYLSGAKSLTHLPDSHTSAKAVSRWLKIKEVPEEVSQYFKSFESMKYAESKAMFFTHDPGRWVIHCKSPKVDSISKALDEIATLYQAIIELYIYALKIGEIPSGTKLHISPFSTENFIVNKALLPHMPLLTRAAWALAMARMPIEELKPLTPECIAVCVLNPRELELYRRAFKKGLDLQAPFGVNLEMNEVIRKHATHHWVRTDNKGNDRLERLMACFQTQCAAWNMGYLLPDRTHVPLTGVQEMIEGTEFFLIDDAVNYMNELQSYPSYTTAYTVSGMVEGVQETAMEVAYRRAQQGYRVGAINAASAYHCGGGVLTGGRHALEESWCVCSTLLTSLMKMVYLAHKESERERANYQLFIPGLDARHTETLSADRRRKSMGLAPRPEVAHGFARASGTGSEDVRRRTSSVHPAISLSGESTAPRGRHSVAANIMRKAKKAFLQPQKQHHEAYLPVQGVVLSPDVELFRKTSTSGYAFMFERQKLAGIISMAAFNRNSRIADSPVDAPKDKEVYESQLTDKWRSALVGAIKLGCEVLIVPDVGCGVFKNDPALTGNCLNVVLRELHGHFREIILLGKDQFTVHARRSFATKRLTYHDSDEDRYRAGHSRASTFVRSIGSVIRRSVKHDESTLRRRSSFFTTSYGRHTIEGGTDTDRGTSTHGTSNYATTTYHAASNPQIGTVNPTAQRPHGVGISGGPVGGSSDMFRSDLEGLSVNSDQERRRTAQTRSTKLP